MIWFRIEGPPHLNGMHGNLIGNVLPADNNVYGSGTNANGECGLGTGVTITQARPAVFARLAKGCCVMHLD